MSLLCVGDRTNKCTLIYKWNGGGIFNRCSFVVVYGGSVQLYLWNEHIFASGQITLAPIAFLIILFWYKLDFN